MIAISPALASIGLFGTPAWDFYRNVSPVMVRVTNKRHAQAEPHGEF
jgi:hypothetical protein